jgi:hypothetical protein
MNKLHKVNIESFDFFSSFLNLHLLLTVLVGLFISVFGLFSGFLIAEQNFPTFWLFMYWLNPLHYALEGLIMSQFHGDDTPIKTIKGEVMTAEDYMTSEQFSTWSYDDVPYDALALSIYIVASM